MSGVSPVLEINVVMRQGAYEAQYLSLMGVSQSFLEQIPLGEGRLPEPGEMGMVVGNTVQQNFYNSKTGRGYWDTGEMPDVDFMNKPLLSFLMWTLISRPEMVPSVRQRTDRLL